MGHVHAHIGVIYWTPKYYDNRGRPPIQAQSMKQRAKTSRRQITLDLSKRRTHWMSVSGTILFYRDLQQGSTEHPQLENEHIPAPSVKAMNGTDGYQSLIPTVLVFGVMPQIPVTSCTWLKAGAYNGREANVNV